MKVLSFTLLLFCCCFMSLAQGSQVSLLLQSPDGKTVKLLWLLNGKSDVPAFDIKRKDGLQGWVKLNKAPIVPGISTQKKLGIVENDKTEVVKLWNKLTELLAENKIHETDSNFARRLATDDNAVKELTETVSADFDIALIMGFGYVDHSVTKRNAYQYGLFAAGTDKQLATATWNYGETPDLNLVQDITSRAVAGKKGITLIWNADLDKIRAGYVTGFNIYRMGIRLNELPITALNTKDLTEFTWFDKNASPNQMHHYSISAASVLGLEGLIKPYVYNPADHPKNYRQPEVTNVVAQGYYFKDGINVQWSFPKEYERFVKGVYVEKDNIPDGYKRVSQLLDPSARTFADRTGSPVSSYIRFRVVAVYNDRTVANGGDRLYSYFPISTPPVPLNVSAHGLQEEKKYTVSLTWDPPMRGDTLTGHYKVYVCMPLNNKFQLLAEKVPLKSGYKHVIQHGTAALYKYSVVAVGKQGGESPISDTIAVQVPTLELPAPAINKVIVANQNVYINWDYPEIPDVKGFRLLLNDQVVATEHELKRNLREFVTARLEQGTAYNITLRAITESGVLSDVSVPAEVIVPKNRK